MTYSDTNQGHQESLNDEQNAERNRINSSSARMTGGDRSQRKTNCKLIQTDAERKKELVLPLRLCLQRHVVLRGIGPLCFLFSDVLPPFLQQFPKTNTY